MKNIASLSEAVKELELWRSTEFRNNDETDESLHLLKQSLDIVLPLLKKREIRNQAAKNMAITDLLMTVFKCKKPFLQNPIQYQDGEYINTRYLTISGEKAYDKLITVLYATKLITETDNIDEAVEVLDQLVSTDA